MPTRGQDTLKCKWYPGQHPLGMTQFYFYDAKFRMSILSVS